MRLAEFRAQAQGALSDAHRHDGFLCGHVGRQALGDGGEEVVFVSVWQDLQSLYRWVGGTDLLDTPVLTRGAPDVFETYEVQHYEVWEAGDRTEVDDQPEAGVG